MYDVSRVLKSPYNISPKSESPTVIWRLRGSRTPKSDHRSRRMFMLGLIYIYIIVVVSFFKATLIPQLSLSDKNTCDTENQYCRTMIMVNVSGFTRVWKVRVSGCLCSYLVSVRVRVCVCSSTYTRLYIIVFIISGRLIPFLDINTDINTIDTFYKVG